MAMEKTGLVLTRKVGEWAVLRNRVTGEEIARVTLIGLRRDRARIHFAAGFDIDIQRAENLEKQDAERRGTATSDNESADGC
jgi:sRNA-binding carbon storage regulator CsrA